MIDVYANTMVDLLRAHVKEVQVNCRLARKKSAIDNCRKNGILIVERRARPGARKREKGGFTDE